MDSKAHWDSVHSSQPPDRMSWYQRDARLSLELVRRASAPGDAVVDVGAGSSPLVDGLLAAGYTRITVLDIAESAFAESRTRLGDAAHLVSWIAADVLIHPFPAASVDVWHDRAVFHFLTAAEDRRRYVGQVVRALRPGGVVVMATFALGGPTRCSGLDVVRYSPASLQEEFRPGFRLLETREEEHRTPADQQQRFLYCVFRRDPAEGDTGREEG